VTTFGLLSALLVKPAALATVALGMTTLMRRTRANARHSVWVAAIGAMLALPLLAAVLPDLRLPSLDTGARRVAAAAQKSSLVHERVPTPDRQPQVTARSTSSANYSDIDPDSNGAFAVLLIWALIASVMLGRRVVAELRVLRLVRDAGPVSDRLTRFAARIARASNLSSADVRITGHVASPVVVGLTRPIVLLPASAESWKDADLEAMLVHELGHVARHDCLINFCADIVSSLYWCNPLVRLSTRRLRLEAERACDERVVTRGTDPRVYAELLLRVARAALSAPALTRAATAMSRARELESRLVAMLDGRASYPPLSRAVATLLIVVGAAVTVPAAALTVSAAEAPAVSDEPVQQAMPTEPDRLADSLAAPESERLPRRPEDGRLDRRVAEALAGEDSVVARRLVRAAQHTPAHSADFVRERAAWALARATNGRLVEPLLESLSDPDWRVQSYAAWALAIAGDARAVPRLVPLVRHPVWRLRAMAAYAVRESRDPRAVDVMRAALTDPAWQVRTEAVEYFAALGGADATELIRVRLTDRHLAVRRAAQSALGIH
jgi:beta-lactamase regulating signal transducer with metallopeptidase domain/HEAT repeat protein